MWCDGERHRETKGKEKEIDKHKQRGKLKIDRLEEGRERDIERNKERLREKER